jgi:hypothetical protein
MERARTTTEACALAFLAADGDLAAAGRACGVHREAVRKWLLQVVKPMQEIRSEGALTTIRAWAAERGLLPTDPVMPGFTIRRTTHQTDEAGNVEKAWVTQAKAPGGRGEIPAGHVVKGVSQLRDAEGRVTQEWVKTCIDPIGVDVVSAIRAAFETYRGQAALVAPPAHTDDDLLSVYIVTDVHHGLLTYGKESGED